ncbi:MAG TPA: prephenate dehydrogenase [Nocardioidaceae bacterium]|nr:prephenate dehydrogenase [Nocardioidaceae bacterium]
MSAPPPADPTPPPDGLPGPVVVVGAGLIGASIGLALRRAGVAVHLEDHDRGSLRLAESLGAGSAAPPPGDPVLVLVAVPPDHIAGVVVEALRRWRGAAVSDVGSVKVRPLAEVSAAAPDEVRRYVGSHPMAGSERSGPLAASSALFDGRAWATCAAPGADSAAVELVERLVATCRAVLVRMSPAEHDAAVARISHLPHVLSALAAARLVDAPSVHLTLAGQGLRDVTRVAAGDPGLWQQILGANAGSVAALLREVRDDIDRLVLELRTAEPRLLPLLRRGVEGTRTIPGKHGGPVRTEAPVFVVVPDRPGELARLFADAGDAGINIEDVRIDHDPGRPAGLVEISVTDGAAEDLVVALGDRGWVAHR